MKKLMAVVGSILLVAGCGSDEPTETASVQEGAGLTFTDMWTKATDTEMTGSFGTITNGSDEDIHVVSVATDAGEMSQLHETVMKDGSMVMQEMADGFVVPAGESYILEPGGNHLMFMKLTEELVAGDVITVTIETEGGESFDFESDVRSYTGAQEEYGVHGEDEDMDHEGHDHGDDHEGHDHEGHDHDEDQSEDN